MKNKNIPPATGHRLLAPCHRLLAPCHRLLAPCHRPLAPGNRPLVSGNWPLAPGHCRSGFTLVEMLVAMVLTLILVTSIAQFYAIVGDSVKDGRAMIEMNQQLRATVERLKSDLDQVTVPVVPWADEGGAAGYFTIFEGPYRVSLGTGAVVAAP